MPRWTPILALIVFTSALFVPACTHDPSESLTPNAATSSSPSTDQAENEDTEQPTQPENTGISGATAIPTATLTAGEIGIVEELAPAGDLPVEMNGSAFAVAVSGGRSNRLDGNGYIGCENGRIALRAENTGMGQITLILPPDAQEGTYEIKENGSDASAAWGLASFTDGAVYAGHVSGTLNLRFYENAPAARIGGYFTFTASNLRNNVTVKGAFDFTAPASQWFCPLP
ncbi:MAG: hypothetical protein KC546_01065 [Anaerolineae bacterium]|nr:hypothetical protein [Anaerolineae bacterium]